MPFDFGETASAGETMQVACHVIKGDPPLSITWYFNSKIMTPHKGVLTTQIGNRASFLSIPVVQPEHRGRYTCVATNLAGSATFAADLHVNGTPF